MAVYVRDFSGGNTTPAYYSFPVAATQTLAEGDVVVLSSGKVAKAGAATGRVLGVMAQASSGASAGTMVKVFVANPSQIWQMVATADATSHVLAARTYDLNSSQLVDVADTTGGCIVILELAGSTTIVNVAFTETEF